MPSLERRVLAIVSKLIAFIAAFLMSTTCLLPQKPDTSLKANSAVSVPHSAISADWNGTWKMNPSKSNFLGPFFTISISAEGEYRFNDGHSSFAFQCDGKDRPIAKNRTQGCVKSSDTALDLTTKENGTKTKVSHWEISADGKMFTATATAFRSTGSVVTGQIFAARISGSSGFAGQWRDTRYLQQHAELTLRLDTQALHIGYPNAGQYVDVPLTGIDTPLRGPHAPSGVTYSVQSVRQHEILISSKRDGKTLTQDSFALSKDGKLIINSWWNPENPTAKGIIVYEKK